MSVSSTEHLDKLAFILYDRPAGRNVIGYAIEMIEQLRADNERLRADRRERIATAALNGLIANAVVAHTPDVLALAAVVMADALIAELDKEEGKP